MARYIDAQKLKKRIECYPPAIREVAMNAVAHAKTENVIPVVRCADCKWFQCNMRQDGYLPDGVSEYECRHWCGPCDPTDYCSHGAKMEEDNG